MLSDLESIDPNVVNKLFNDLIVHKSNDHDNADAQLQSLDPELTLNTGVPSEELDQMRDEGLRLIKEGKVAVVILAGG